MPKPPATTPATGAHRAEATDRLTPLPDARPTYDDLVTVDLFAGIPVSDYDVATAWYERLLGAPPSFLPNDIEAVWELADRRYVFIEVRPHHAGHAMNTVFVSDFDARISHIAERGLEPADHETYAN